ncbi:MAG: phosphoribosylamine--glycine ligase [Patescibacteria group bacterium]|nr:phosphoribosylamine--glycine ligase [Patescibacteria group bacterium]
MAKKAKLNVMVIGSGGREAALVEKISQSPLAGKIYCLPGNGGISRTAQCVPIDAKYPSSIVSFAKVKKIGLAVIGPEAPLVAGLSDRLRRAGIPVFGPSKKASILEGSKAAMKQLLRRYEIPTAAFDTFSNPDSALEYMRRKTDPHVFIKTSGLASGKGAIDCPTLAEAENTIRAMMVDKKFGDAGNQIVIEDFLSGEEASFMAFVDGKRVLPLATAQDHKRARDNDQGPNTGGMGAYSPAPVVTPALSEKIMETIMKPTVEAMKNEGMPFRGLLYAGLMIDGEDVRVLEFNIRFGDPEIQPILLRMKSDILPFLLATAKGSLAGMTIQWDPRPALCVVMVSGEYPEKPKTGLPISGLEEAACLADVQILHAATGLDPRSGVYLTAGGRVIDVSAKGDKLFDAQTRAYQAVKLIRWENARYRTDIGFKAIGRA